MAEAEDRTDRPGCLKSDRLLIPESGSSSTGLLTEIIELTQRITRIKVSSFIATKFVINTIVYVPEGESTSDSSDEEEDGSFPNDCFNFDSTNVASLPFTTDRPKFKRKLRTSNGNFEELLNSKEDDSTDSKIVGPFLEKLSENGFDILEREKNAAAISATIALNRMKSLSSRKNKSLIFELGSKVTTNVRYEKFGFYWLCEWYDRKGQLVDYCTVRKFYKQLKRSDPAKAKEFLKICEDRNSVSYQELREYVKNHDLTKKLVQEFREKSPDANIYLSLIDSDTVDFNGIYSAYLRIVADSLKRSVIHTVMSTGYEFSETERDGSVYKLASQIDKMIRVITARYLPLGIYYPEPNMCILIPHDRMTLPESFIDKQKKLGNLESACLLKQLQNRENASYIFSEDKPLITAIPDRAKLTKAHKMQISFSPEFKQGASPTEDDVKKFKQVSQSHFNEKTWYNSLFINDAIKFREYNVEDYVSNPEKVLYCQNLLKTVRNSTVMNNYRAAAVAELKRHMPPNVVEVMIKKYAFQHCIRLLAQFCKLQDDTEAKRAAVSELMQYISPDDVEQIIKAAKSVEQYVNRFPITHIRSTEEAKLLKILEKYNIPIKSCSPDKLRILAQREIVELMENEIIEPIGLVELEIYKLEEIIDEEIIDAVKNGKINFKALLDLAQVPDHFADYIDVKETGEYEISDIVKAYEEHPFHLKFMKADDPNSVIYENSDDSDIVKFGLANYGDEIDLQSIRDNLNDHRSDEKDYKAALMDFDRILIGLDYM